MRSLWGRVEFGGICIKTVFSYTGHWQPKRFNNPKMYFVKLFYQPQNKHKSEGASTAVEKLISQIPEGNAEPTMSTAKKVKCLHEHVILSPSIRVLHPSFVQFG